ncbi:MAG: RNA polymerase factor sigma-54 [Flavobacteriales bacterium]
MLKQSLHQKLLQKLSPQQIQLMKLIQLPTLELEEEIINELEENPALEEGLEQPETSGNESEQQEVLHDEDTDFIDAKEINIDQYLSDDEVPSYKTQVNNQPSSEDDDKVIPFAVGHSFHEFLVEQVSLLALSDKEEALAKYLIGSLNSNGYLRRDLEEIVDDLAFNMNIMVELDELEYILKKVQSLDPAGVGGRSLQECLAIQLHRKTESPVQILALEIVEKEFEAFSKKHFTKLKSIFHCSDAELKEVNQLISKLNPKPGNSHSSTSTRSFQQIVPDFELKIVDNQLEFLINGRNVPDLRVNKQYVQMIETFNNSKDKSSKAKHDAALFAKQKLDSAKWFIDAIRQRHQTLQITMQTIIDIQKEYFLTGDESKMKPMILKDVAEIINMDISTVSRVANSKYISTPYGTKLVKEFFSESMKNSKGEDISTREIKKALQEVIDAENKKKPLTDDNLAKQLKEKGYPIARRTIAKYREQLKIPVARMRKRL